MSAVGRSVSYKKQIARIGIAMVLPVLLVMGLFTLYPYSYAIWASFQNLSPLFPTTFVGIENYVNILSSNYFVRAASNTLIFAFVAVPVTVLLGVVVATLLNQRFKGNVLVRALVLLPWAIPTAISGVIWKGVFADTWGALNAVLYTLGLITSYIRWLTTANLAMATVVVAQVWTQFPLAAILILASMQTIPDELYESAAIDGAGIWQRFRFITIPGILAMLVIVTIYESLIALTTFDITYGLTGGGPGTATTLISYFTWAETFRMLAFGRGAALSVIIALVALLLIFALLLVLPKDALVEE